MISIITAFYNAEKFLAESIESVLAQTHVDWELLLIDDCSSDQSAVIALKYAQADKRITIVTLEQNSGTGIARNKGIEQAKGSKIAFLDADDRWKPHKLATQLQFMEKNQASICFSSYTLMNENGKPLNIAVQALPVLDFNTLLRANYIGNLTALYDVERLGKQYAPALRKRQDWALWLDLVKKAGKAYGISESLAYYRVRKDSISGNKWKMLRYNFAVYNQYLEFSRLKSAWMMLRFLWEQFFIKRRQVKVIKAASGTV
ncbi:MAG TPA: glycosyltransferase family 2 protein [Leeuwenhoekiella sp.]|nr:glycosyltransferase family 2 protein [Leeuwenhoekiella sp.]